MAGARAAHRAVSFVCVALCLLAGCSDLGGGSSGSAGSGATSSYPIVYKGTATLHTTYAIQFDDKSSKECWSTGAWTATVQKDKVSIEGEVKERAQDTKGTTACIPVQETLYHTGTHDGEHFTIQFNYESTPVKMVGSFGAEFLGSYDASWTGKIAGFGGITKTEDVSLALPRVP